MSVRLGKLEYRHDPRTARLGQFLAPAPGLKVPTLDDFDHGRAPFPVSSWGNDQWSNCVIGGRVNHALRLERVERHATPLITPNEAVDEYKSECLRQFGHAPATAGDGYDNGLYVLEAIKDWRNEGWQIRLTKRSKNPSKQSIAAYGEIDKMDTAEVRAAIFFMHGVQMGLSLPNTAARQWASHQAWTVAEGNDPDTQPGSWGGHLVYCKRYDAGGVYCMTWGHEVYMTNAFIARYCDECWAVVDDLDNNKVSRYLDVQAMIQHLRDVGASGIT